jgi:Holliday junction resolvase RusA-like endonuclease
MISFFVPGIPRPGGSKRGFVIPGTKRVIITEDCKRSKDWRTSVGFMAADCIKTPLSGPLEVQFIFIMPRPQGHFGSGRNAHKIKSSAPEWPAVKPDVTKLVRSTEDAMKGIAWRDDSQVIIQHAEKRYGDSPGARIMICKLGVIVESDLLQYEETLEQTTVKKDICRSGQDDRRLFGM